MHGIYTICDPLKNAFKIDFSASLLYNPDHTAQEANTKDRSRGILLDKVGCFKESRSSRSRIVHV